MAKVKRTSDGRWAFNCPGCNEDHEVTDAWQFNGNADLPTFTPSVHVKTGHYVTSHGDPDHPCWCTHNAERIAEGKQPSGFQCQNCHSFVTDGKIQFLGDSTHELKGQTVELPDWETTEAMDKWYSKLEESTKTDYDLPAKICDKCGQRCNTDFDLARTRAWKEKHFAGECGN